MSLNKGQQKALDAAMNGENMFLTGGAGTGKSFTLASIIDALEDEGLNVLVCAPTGIAALNIGGITINKAFWLNFDPKVANEIDDLKLSRYVERADVIIIDEISMVRRDTMDAIAHELDMASHSQQLIVCGDFGQLPPVVTSEDHDVLEKYFGPDFSPYAFSSEGWNKYDIEPHILTEQMRQSNDSGLSSALDQARLGNRDCLQYFSNLARKPAGHPIYLMGRNRDVDAENKRALNTLTGRKYTYQGRINGDFAKSAMPAPATLELKEDARVMFTANDQDSHEYVNGQFGTVESCRDLCVIVVTDDDKEVVVRPYTWESTSYALNYDNISGKTRLEKYVCGTYTQLPLRLAYAMTFHKSQGQTLQSAYIAPANFQPGQLYVGLSRTGDASTLGLTRPLFPNDLKADPRVVRFYRDIGFPS